MMSLAHLLCRSVRSATTGTGWTSDNVTVTLHDSRRPSTVRQASINYQLLFYYKASSPDTRGRPQNLLAPLEFWPSPRGLHVLKLVPTRRPSAHLSQNLQLATAVLRYLHEKSIGRGCYNWLTPRMEVQQLVPEQSVNNHRGVN